MPVEMAIGDAYGAGFEYAPEPFVRARNNLAGHEHTNGAESGPAATPMAPK